MILSSKTVAAILFALVALSACGSGDNLVTQADSAEATGSLGPPETIPSVAPGVAEIVQLVLGDECRNDGTINAGGVRWQLTEGAPFEWAGRSPIIGDLEMDGEFARFTPNGDDGTPTFTVTLTTGATNADCPLWDRPEPVEPSSVVGNLDCGDRSIVEERVADDDSEPLDVATAFIPSTVRVEPASPLFWDAFGEAGELIGTLAIGDTDNPDWQIWTCASDSEGESLSLPEGGFVEMLTLGESGTRGEEVTLAKLLESAGSINFVSGSVVGVELGPTHTWETDPDTGAATRSDVSFDSPEAMVQMLHVEIAPRYLAASDLSDFEDSVVLAIAASPGTSTSAVFDELSGIGDIATFIFTSPVADYRPDLWTDLLDGQGIGFVQADSSVAFPSGSMNQVSIENIDSFVEDVLADAGFETRSGR